MGEAELRVNQSRQTALDEGTPSPGDLDPGREYRLDRFLIER